MRRCCCAIVAVSVLSAMLACRPAAYAADALDVRVWEVPWNNAEPADPHVDAGGRVWFAARRGRFIGNLLPETGEFNRYDLPPRTTPQSLVVDARRTIWFANAGRREIVSLDPSTGRVTAIEIGERAAKDPHSLALDADGNVWFTVSAGNFIGQVSAASNHIALMPVPTRKARPDSIVIDHRGTPWATAAGSNRLLRVERSDLIISEIATPDEDVRMRGLAVTSDGAIWFANHAGGSLGRYDPGDGRFAAWPMPGGEDSKPDGMTADRQDRLWIVETGRRPNRLVGFDTQDGAVIAIADIPGDGDTDSSLFYYAAAGEVWFATEGNLVGRAKVH